MLFLYRLGPKTLVTASGCVSVNQAHGTLSLVQGCDWRLGRCWTLLEIPGCTLSTCWVPFSHPNTKFSAENLPLSQVGVRLLPYREANDREATGTTKQPLNAPGFRDSCHSAQIFKSGSGATQMELCFSRTGGMEPSRMDSSPPTGTWDLGAKTTLNKMMEWNTKWISSPLRKAFGGPHDPKTPSRVNLPCHDWFWGNMRKLIWNFEPKGSHESGHENCQFFGQKATSFAQKKKAKKRFSKKCVKS